jgi:Domain of unknown function (DUF6379)
MDYISAMQSSRVISDNGLSATRSGFKIDIRLPWYRSLPLSTVEVDEVSVDGKRVDPARIQFELEGRSYPLSAMPDLIDKVWYVLDSAYLNVEASALPAGSEHSISVTLNLYPPYIRGLKRVSRETKTLRAL